jgi:radical SAM superfamily enzyme YgiQ (UPF0313 family)
LSNDWNRYTGGGRVPAGKDHSSKLQDLYYYAWDVLPETSQNLRMAKLFLKVIEKKRLTDLIGERRSATEIAKKYDNGAKPMKVLLISANVTLSPYPLYPLGVSIIAGALTRAGHEVRQADFLQQNSSLEAIAREASEFGPDLVGISVRNIDNVNLLHEQYYIQNVKNLVDSVRTVPRAKVLGRRWFSLIPALILKETGADYGIIGEGEVLAVEFANNAAKGVYPEETLISAPAKLPGDQIDAALYDERLLEFYLHSGNIASIQTKRGCTYKCVYCTYPVLEGAELRRRAKTVVDDMVLLRDNNDHYVFFVDSVLNDDDGPTWKRSAKWNDGTFPCPGPHSSSRAA